MITHPSSCAHRLSLSAREIAEEDIQQIQALVSTLTKVKGYTDLIFHMNDLSKLESASKIPAIHTVAIIQSNSDMQKKISTIIEQHTLGSVLLLDGKLGRKGIVQRLQEENPNSFATREEARRWLQKEWCLC